MQNTKKFYFIPSHILKKLFRKYPKNHQKTPRMGSVLSQVESLQLVFPIQDNFIIYVLFWVLPIFSKQVFCGTTTNNCLWNLGIYRARNIYIMTFFHTIIAIFSNNSFLLVRKCKEIAQCRIKCLHGFLPPKPGSCIQCECRKKPVDK